MFRTLLLRGAFRIPMDSKRGNRMFYKGRGARSTGFRTRKGGFIVDPYKQVRYIVPNLSDCTLQPYVSYQTPRVTAYIPSADDLLKMTITIEERKVRSQALEEIIVGPDPVAVAKEDGGKDTDKDIADKSTSNPKTPKESRQSQAGSERKSEAGSAAVPVEAQPIPSTGVTTADSSSLPPSTPLTPESNPQPKNDSTQHTNEGSKKS